MVKAISVTLPEKLILEVDAYCDEYMMNRSELIKNALVRFIRGTPDEVELTPGLTDEEEEALERNIRAKEASEKTVDEVPVPQEPPQPELPPFCDANKFCRSRSTGQFKIITNDGTNEVVRYLCPTHLGLAKREGEVREI